MTLPQIHIHNISYNLPTGKSLFENLTVMIPQKRVGLMGRNGVGKSTLLKLIMGELTPSAGTVHIQGSVEYVPQNPPVAREMTVASFLGCDEKIHALQRITNGSLDESDYAALNDEWDIEEQVLFWLSAFGLSHVLHYRNVSSLSGGETTSLYLAKAFFAKPGLLLLDEPTNHLDSSSREQLYQTIRQWKGGLIVVSHDRALLNCMDEIVELTTLGANNYGGNYDHYIAQKAIENAAHLQQLQNAQKNIHKAKNTVQASREKHEHKQSYGRELRRSGSIDKLAANSKKGRSERTQSKLLIKEQRLIHQAELQLQSAKDNIEINEEIRVELPATHVANGKMMLEIEDLNFAYLSDKPVIRDFTLKMQGPERWALAGHNGSGKTTLVKLILQELQPQSGKIQIGTDFVRYLDQNASMLAPNSTILENFLCLNPDAKENDAYRSLAQFLFRNVAAQKLVRELSGGEKLRAFLACVLLSKHPPQLLILDEPTNHLDLHSIRSIESALSNYQGAMIVISHDPVFLNSIGITKVINAPFI